MTTLQINPLDVLADPGYAMLKDYIIANTGLAYYCDKDDDLGRRIGNRLMACDLPDCTTYHRCLDDPQRGGRELDHLVEELTVGETSFFRHAELFDGLCQVVLPDLLARNQEQRRLRIWSAGCSIGAEAYSLAILLSREFAVQTAGWDISILGTDINRRFLRQAEEGMFHAWDFRGARRHDIEGCFTRFRDTWIIRPEYRRGVSFQYHNLVRHPFPSLVNNLVAFDLILCRNVLIYFRPEITQQIIDQFRSCLIDDGWLLVGHAEPNTKLFREYRTVNFPGAVLYQNAAPAPVEHSEAVFDPTMVTIPVLPCMDYTPCYIENRAPTPAPAQSEKSSTGASSSAVDTSQWARIQDFADHGELASAMSMCQAMARADSMNPTVQLYLAMLAEQMGDHRQSEASLRRALYLKPDSPIAHYYCGLFHHKRGRAAEAFRSFNNVLKCLGQRDSDEAIAEADGMTVGELRELTRMQQEILTHDC